MFIVRPLRSGSITGCDPGKRKVSGRQTHGPGRGKPVNGRGFLCASGTFGTWNSASSARSPSGGTVSSSRSARRSSGGCSPSCSSTRTRSCRPRSSSMSSGASSHPRRRSRPCRCTCLGCASCSAKRRSKPDRPGTACASGRVLSIWSVSSTCSIRAGGCKVRALSGRHASCFAGRSDSGAARRLRISPTRRSHATRSIGSRGCTWPRSSCGWRPTLRLVATPRRSVSSRH